MRCGRSATAWISGVRALAILLPETLDDHAGAVDFRRPDERQRHGRFRSAAKSPGSLCRSGSSGRCSGFASARRCWRSISAPGSRRIREGRAQIGYYPIRPDAGRAEICPDWPDHVYHWHREGFELPPGANLLAEGSDFPIQAFRYDHSFGFQFHPDVTNAMMHRWTTRGTCAPGIAGRSPAPPTHFADRAVHDVAERAWLRQFLDGWLARTASA